MINLPNNINIYVLKANKFKQLKQRWQLLVKIAIKICQSWQLEEILQITVSEIKKLLQIDRGLICHFGADSTRNMVIEAVRQKLIQI